MSERALRRVLMGIAAIVLFIVGVYAGQIYPTRQPCPGYDQISSTEDAVAFAKYWLARDKKFLSQVGIQSAEELYGTLTKDCCSVERKSAENGSSIWNVGIGTEEKGKYAFEYYLEFDACRLNVSHKSLTTKY
jgi:hypothetical protein